MTCGDASSKSDASHMSLRSGRVNNSRHFEDREGRTFLWMTVADANLVRWIEQCARDSRRFPGVKECGRREHEQSVRQPRPWSVYAWLVGTLKTHQSRHAGGRLVCNSNREARAVVLKEVVSECTQLCWRERGVNYKVFLSTNSMRTNTIGPRRGVNECTNALVDGRIWGQAGAGEFAEPVKQATAKGLEELVDVCYGVVMHGLARLNSCVVHVILNQKLYNLAAGFARGNVACSKETAETACSCSQLRLYRVQGQHTQVGLST